MMAQDLAVLNVEDHGNYNKEGALDYSGKDLSNHRVIGGNGSNGRIRQEINFTGSNLEGATIQANARRINFTDADLTNANLSESGSHRDLYIIDRRPEEDAFERGNDESGKNSDAKTQKEDEEIYKGFLDRARNMFKGANLTGATLPAIQTSPKLRLTLPKKNPRLRDFDAGPKSSEIKLEDLPIFLEGAVVLPNPARLGNFEEFASAAIDAANDKLKGSIDKLLKIEPSNMLIGSDDVKETIEGLYKNIAKNNEAYVKSEKGRAWFERHKPKTEEIATSDIVKKTNTDLPDFP